MHDDTEQLWTTERVAQFLDVNPETLARWRRRGYGPKAIPLADGGPIRYDPAAVKAWVAERAKVTA